MKYKRGAKAVYTAPRGGRRFPGVLQRRVKDEYGEWWFIAYERDGKPHKSKVRPKTISVK